MSHGSRVARAVGDASTRRALAMLHRVPVGRMTAFVPLQHDASDARQCQQGSREWFAHRHGHLTASQFAAALGFNSPGQQRKVLRDLFSTAPPRETFDACTDSLRESGAQWGHRYERSALATYLTAYVQPRCSTARLLETGFWPIASHPSGLAMGASPDALLEGWDSAFPGGVSVEVKCPFGGGIPRAQGKVHPRQMPQIQGTLLATGRAHCHFVTWSPSGAAIYHVRSEPAYQQAMVESLASITSAARAGRRLDTAEQQAAKRVRVWSADLALGARMLVSLDASRCVMLVEAEGSGADVLDGSSSMSSRA